MAVCTLLRQAVTCETPVDLYLAADHSPRFAAVPRPLLPVVRRATRPDPSERYGTAEEMADALRAVRAAVSDLPAAPRRPETPDGAHPRTAVPGAAPALSIEAGVRERRVEESDYAWSSRAIHPGRTALWVGVVAVGVIAVVGAVAPSVIEGRVGPRASPSPVPEDPVEALASPAGTWIGNFDGNKAMLELAGEPDDLSGELELWLGSHQRKARVTGSWDAAARRLVLEDQGGTPGAGRYEAVLDDDGLVLRGRFVPLSGADPIRFALLPLD